MKGLLPWIFAGLLSCCLLSSVTAWGQPGSRLLPPPGALGLRAQHEAARQTLGPVEVKMMVIHATNAIKGMDREIEPLSRHLGFLNYSGYRLLFRNDMGLMPLTTRSMGLFDGKVIEVTLNSVTPEKAVLRVRMFNPRQPDGVALDTTVSVVRKGTFFIGGPRYEGGVLLLPITAWY